MGNLYLYWWSKALSLARAGGKLLRLRCGQLTILLSSSAGIIVRRCFLSVASTAAAAAEAATSLPTTSKASSPVSQPIALLSGRMITGQTGGLLGVGAWWRGVVITGQTGGLLAVGAWRRGVVVSNVRRVNEVNARRVRLVLG